MVDFNWGSLIRVIRCTEGASRNTSSRRMEKLVNLVKFVGEKTSETSVNLNIQPSLDVIYIGANVESVSAWRQLPSVLTLVVVIELLLGDGNVKRFAFTWL